MKMNFKNIDRVARGIKSLGNANKGLSIEAVDETANTILDEAERRCPVKTGELKKSGRVLKRKTRQVDVERRVVKFGNSKAPYAAFVHYVPIPHAIGEALFLDKAVLIHGRKLPQLIKAKFKFRRITS